MKGSDKSRRNFVKNMAAFTAGIPFLAAVSEAKASPFKETDRRLLKPFGYQQVQLTGGPLKHQFDRIVKLYTSIDNDTLLKPMREAAGMPAPGRDMGGWYDYGTSMATFAPGHCFGQLLSALSRFYAITQDEKIKEKVADLVKGFDETIRIPESTFFANLRYPAYTYDKHVLGLTDAYALASVTEALAVLNRATQQALKYLPGKALTRQEMAARPHKDVSYTWDESYLLPENLFQAYLLTRDESYKSMARQYLHDKPFFIPLSKGEQALVGQHAYSHFHALSSAAKAYEILGDKMHLQAILNAWEMMEKNQQYASGGWGPNEGFIEPGKGLLGKSLTTTKNHFEAPCGSYAHTKLGRYLIGFTGDSRYGDSIERVIFNASLAARDPKRDGSAFYYLNHAPLAKKEYHPDKCPCCFGGLAMVVSDYGQNIYFHQEDALYVNLYAGSRVKWQAGQEPVTVEQVTNYPEESTSRFTISLSQSKTFTLHLRIPAWVNPQTVKLQINKQDFPFKGKAGSFFAVKRKWKNNDQLQISFDFPQYTLPIDDQHPNTVAFMDGPLMLAGIQPTISLAKNKLNKSEKGYTTGFQAGNFILKPLYQINDEIYTSYFQV